MQQITIRRQIGVMVDIVIACRQKVNYPPTQGPPPPEGGTPASLEKSVAVA
jgi:hypothetical protein